MTSAFFWVCSFNWFSSTKRALQRFSRASLAWRDFSFSSLVGLARLFLLFFHLVEGQQCLLVALANVIEVLFQCTVVFEQLLLFVDAALIVSQQLLLLVSLLTAGLQFEIVCYA